MSRVVGSSHYPGRRPEPVTSPACLPLSPVACPMTDEPQARHVAVLPAEVLDLLAPQPGQVFVDATLGAGGHARLLAECLGPTGRLIALDQDETMLARARPRLSDLPVTLVHRNFDELPRVLKELSVESVDGVLADLGVCSDQLDAP